RAAAGRAGPAAEAPDEDCRSWRWEYPFWRVAATWVRRTQPEWPRQTDRCEGRVASRKSRRATGPQRGVPHAVHRPPHLACQPHPSRPRTRRGLRRRAAAAGGGARRRRDHCATAAAGGALRGGTPATGRPWRGGGLGAGPLALGRPRLGLGPRPFRRASPSHGRVGRGPLGGAAQWHLGLGSRPLALTGTAATLAAYNRQIVNAVLELSPWLISLERRSASPRCLPHSESA